MEGGIQDAGVGDAPMVEADPAADAQPAAVAQAPQQAQPSTSESQQPGGIIPKRPA